MVKTAGRVGIALATTFGALLFGCASIVGIGDLPQGGSSSGGTSSGTTSSSSGSGSSSGTSTSSSSSSSSSGTSGGTIAEGAKCPSGSGCQTGLVCVGEVCRIPCATVGDACSNNGVCEEFGTIDACTVPCVPLPDSCQTGLSCEVGILSGTTEALSDCEVAGTAAAGASCGTYDGCVAGSTCPTTLEASPTCGLWCTQANPCARGTCEPYVEFNNVDYGYCQ